MFEHKKAKQVEQKILYSNIQSGEVRKFDRLAFRFPLEFIESAAISAPQSRAINRARGK